jgi:hypothetical protein
VWSKAWLGFCSTLGYTSFLGNLNNLGLKRECCGLIGSKDGSQLKGPEFEPHYRYNRWKWYQSHTGLIIQPAWF